MKAICISSFGGSDVLRYQDIPDPVLRSDDDVVVAIHAASVNAADWKVRSGASAGTPVVFPHVLGRDFSGVVIAAGAQADLSVGDEVWGVIPAGREGAYAQQIAIEPSVLGRKPPQLSHVEAAAIGLAALTAMIALEDTLHLRPGENVLIQGGAGGVGGMAVRIARHHLGARVAATARTQNHDYVRGLGAEQGIDYTREDVAQVLGRSCDAAFDTVGGARLVEQSFAVLRSGGRAAFITVGPQAPKAPRDDVVSLRPAVGRSRAYMDRLAALVASGVLRPPEIQVLPLADARRAHALSEQGHVRGKLVLVPRVTVRIA